MLNVSCSVKVFLQAAAGAKYFPMWSVAVKVPQPPTLKLESTDLSSTNTKLLLVTDFVTVIAILTIIMRVTIGNIAWFVFFSWTVLRVPAI